METTRENVIQELIEEHGHTKEHAEILVDRYKDVFDRCKGMGSFAYYTANEIVEAASKNK